MLRNVWRPKSGYTVRRTTPPVAFTVESVAALKAQLNITHSQQDALLQSHLGAAMSVVEGAQWRALFPQVWTLTLDRFPPSDYPMEVPRPPLISVDSFTYYDQNDVQQNLVLNVDFEVLQDDDFFVLRPPEGAYWPIVNTQRLNSVNLVFTAGYSNVANQEWASLPQSTQQAVKFLAALYYEKRVPVEDVGQSLVPFTLQELMSLESVSRPWP